jgi:translation initiation factor IF-1
MTQLFGNVIEHRSGNTFLVSLNDGNVVDAIVPKVVARDMFRVVSGDPEVVEPSECDRPYRIAGFSPCRYFKRYWNENPGGNCDGWGGSTYFFEVHPDGYVARQIELFDNGNLLLYDETIDEDRYGGRSIVTLEFDEYDEFSIDRTEFNSNWKPSVAVNRQPQNATDNPMDRSRGSAAS